jgi:PAS domain S-box-containing protein
MFVQKTKIDLPSLESIIDRSFLSVSLDTSVAEAIALMRQTQADRCELFVSESSQNLESSSCVLVVEGDKLIGIFTEQDALKLATARIDLDRVPLAKVMASEIVTLKYSPSHSIFSALSLLYRHHIRHLPVVNEREQLLGLITQTDLLSAIDSSFNKFEIVIQQQQQTEQTNQRLAKLLEERTAELDRVNLQWQQEMDSCFTRDPSKEKQAESAHQEILRSLKFQKYALDRAAIVAITDCQGIIIYANDKFCQISQYSKEELIGQTHRIINSGYHPPEFFQELWSTIANGKVWQGEIKNRAKDGTFYWVATTIVPFLDERGKPFQYLAIRFDISEQKAALRERKQTEESLRQSEQKFRAIFDSTFQFIGLLTIEGIIIEANRTALEAIGVDREDVVGKPFWETPWWSHSRKLQKQLQQAIVTAATGKLVRFEAEHILSDGTSAFVDFSLKPVFDETGKVVMLIPEGRDISDRKRSELDRKDAEQKIREQAALLDVATDAILVKDLNHCISFWNKGAEKIYGWQASEAIGKDARSLFYHEVSPQNEIALKTVLEKGEWQGELHKITKMGKKVIAESRWTLVRDEADNPKSILSVDTDITQKKLLEAQFLRAQRLESLGTLASGIAHDMNNILTPILAAAQLLSLKLTNLDSQTKQLIQLLQENAKRGVNLVKQIVSFARGGEGERAQMQIASIVSEVVDIVRQTFPKSIEICLNFASDLWLVSGDATQFHQVFMNLFINARDAMPEGGILTITAENLWVDESDARMNFDAKVGSYVAIAVADTGSGMSEEILEKIFEPFFSTKEPGKGTGLGLSTVLGIIKSHQGFVNVSSQVGKGTSIKIYLPADIQSTN